MMRVALPDRPGSLGAVATALGTAGADIQSVEIVQRQGDVVVDDFLVFLPSGLPDELISACRELQDVDVLWISRTGAGSLLTDLEALEHMVAEPDHALEVLANSAPRLFHAAWASVVTSNGQAVVHTGNSPDADQDLLTPLGPVDVARQVEVPADWLPGWPECRIAVVPLPAGRYLVVGRSGPVFLDSEIARLRHLAANV